MWLYNKTRRRKDCDVFKGENPDVAKEGPMNSCWLCEYVRSIGNHCEDCPINWGSETCLRDGSPFNEWIFGFFFNYEERANLADIIAELPEKGDK